MIKTATHLPVLELMKRTNIRRVLELGSGEYSTKKFLEFPDLEKLFSYEDDTEWFLLMNNLKDRRFITFLEKDLVKVVGEIDLNFFDLIFVDCCQYPEERVAVIKKLAEQRPKAIVIIHDFENKLYQAEAKFDHKIVYDELVPNTAILWNNEKS